MAAVRVSLSWFGTRKSLTAEQRPRPPSRSTPKRSSSSAGKKLLDISHPAFKAVTAVRGKVIAYWKSMSLPYPEPGIRLIRQQKIDAFAAQMREFQEELAEAVQGLRPPLQRTEGHGPAAAGQPVQQQRLSRHRSPACFRDQLRFPIRGAAGLPPATQPAALRGRVPAGAVPFRRGRASGGGGVHRRIGQADLASHRAALRQRRWQAENLPGLGRREPDRVLPAVPRPERPLQRATRQPGGRCPAGHPRRRSARPAGQHRPAAARCHGNVPRRERAGWHARRSSAAEHSASAAVTAAMQLVIEPDGTVRCIYSEEIDLAAIGSPTIARASHVEPDQQGRWQADHVARRRACAGAVRTSQRGPCSGKRLVGKQLDLRSYPKSSLGISVGFRRRPGIGR